MASEILNSDDNKPQIFNIITSKINSAIDSGSNEVILFYYEEENLYHYITNNEYKESLRKALVFFETIENYEECIEIQKIIQKIIIFNNFL